MSNDNKKSSVKNLLILIVFFVFFVGFVAILFSVGMYDIREDEQSALLKEKFVSQYESNTGLVNKISLQEFKKAVSDGDYSPDRTYDSLSEDAKIAFRRSSKTIASNSISSFYEMFQGAWRDFSFYILPLFWAMVFYSLGFAFSPMKRVGKTRGVGGLVWRYVFGIFGRVRALIGFVFSYLFILFVFWAAERAPATSWAIVNWAVVALKYASSFFYFPSTLFVATVLRLSAFVWSISDFGAPIESQVRNYVLFTYIGLLIFSFLLVLILINFLRKLIRNITGKKEILSGKEQEDTIVSEYQAGERGAAEAAGALTNLGTLGTAMNREGKKATSSSKGNIWDAEFKL